MLDTHQLLEIYDDQLRGEVEMTAAVRALRHGPLFWAHLVAGRGFVSYGPLTASAAELTELASATLAHYAADPVIKVVEWKTRGHDQLPDLDEVLRRHGFQPADQESVMLGEASALAVDVPLPAGVTVRRIEGEIDVRRMGAMQGEIFQGEVGGDEDHTDELLQRLASKDEFELWVAEAGAEIVSAGRLEPVPGTEVAGLWGGCTRSEWRGRGIYRALTAERARSALRRGYRYLHSDSTEYSRPILERSGFVKVTTTTPYEWRR